jgi:hypothetical protein
MEFGGKRYWTATWRWKDVDVKRSDQQVTRVRVYPVFNISKLSSLICNSDVTASSKVIYCFHETSYLEAKKFNGD